MTVDFKCVICQADCTVAPADGGWAFCEECCPSHNFENDPWERKAICTECGMHAPPEWYYCDDDRFVLSSGPPVGTPLSQVTGQQLDRVADEWRS